MSVAPAFTAIRRGLRLSDTNEPAEARRGVGDHSHYRSAVEEANYKEAVLLSVNAAGAGTPAGWVSGALTLHLAGSRALEALAASCVGHHALRPWLSTLKLAACGVSALFAGVGTAVNAPPAALAWARGANASLGDPKNQVWGYTHE